MKQEQETEDLLRQLEIEWQQEHQAEKEQFEAQRNQTTLAERIELGYALKALSIEELVRVDEKQSILWFQGTYPQLRLNAGAPVVIIQQTNDNPSALTTALEGYLTKNQQQKIGVMLEYEEAEGLENHWVLEERAMDTSFEKGLAAIQGLQSPKYLSLAALFLGISAFPYPKYDQYANFREMQEKLLLESQWEPLSQSLNPAQKSFALQLLQSAYLSNQSPQALPEIHLLHGPPGTGKSHVLIQMVQALVKLGKKILLCAPSNQAVDHLCIELSKKGLAPIRLGHLSRISIEAEQCTLKNRLAQEERAKLAYEWLRKAKTLRDRCQARKDRHRGDFEEIKQMYQEARSLTQDAKKQLKIVKDYLLEKSAVICATPVGTTDESISHLQFDVLMIDEAAQLMTPLALTAMTSIRQGDPKDNVSDTRKSKGQALPTELSIKARLIVLAGDHQQIGPTLINPNEKQTKQLRQSLFERLIDSKRVTSQMLEIEYRFNEIINTFPSQMHYHQRLFPSPAHQKISLQDFPSVQADDLYQNHALVFIDCAAKGWQEQNDQKSIGNIEMATLSSEQVKRMIKRGVLAEQIIVISPYARQVQNLKNLLVQEQQQGLEIGTIDAFQGREAEVVFVDLVRMNEEQELGFLKEVRRMNVALTRGKRLLVIVADSATIGNHPYYKALLETVDRVGLYLSVWDLWD